MQDFCFLITAYDQVDLVIKNIKRIRSEYPIQLATTKIIVVSTHEEDLFSDKILDDQTLFIHFKDAPGNKLSREFNSKENPAGKYLNWRQEYLPPRILLSIEKGLMLAYDLGIKSALHLHSDTYWEPQKISNLLTEQKEISKYLFIGDLSFPNEYSSFRLKVIPFLLHFQPEGLHFNIQKSKETGFLNFSEIWSYKSMFQSHNFGSIEALIGQYAHFCLCQSNITSYSQSLKLEYINNINFRTIRMYHGKFRYGLVNLAEEDIPSISLKEKIFFTVINFVISIFVKTKKAFSVN